jgi:hypothetical protein
VDFSSPRAEPNSHSPCRFLGLIYATADVQERVLPKAYDSGNLVSNAWFILAPMYMHAKSLCGCAVANDYRRPET